MIRVLSAESVLTQIRNHSRVVNKSSIELIIADFIRSLVWSASVILMKNNYVKIEPVNKRRILFYARQSLKPIFDCPDSSENHAENLFIRVLNELIRVEDLVQLPNGGVAPAPVRLVKLSQPNTFLLIGCIPTRLLPTSLKLMTCEGICRMVKLEDRDFLEQHNIPTQSIYEWLGIHKVYSNITAWFESYLKTTTFLDTGISEIINDTEFFMQMGLTQVGWESQEEIKDDISGTYLCRTITKPVRYYLTKVKSGKVIGYVEQPRTLQRRLRLYYLNRFGRSIVCKVTENSERVYFETLTFNIPNTERKILSAFGIEQKDLEKRQSVWAFSKEGWNEIKPFIIWLGFNLGSR